MPTTTQIELAIELLPGDATTSMTSYRMLPFEFQEVKSQFRGDARVGVYLDERLTPRCLRSICMKMEELMFMDYSW